MALSRFGPQLTARLGICIDLINYGTRNQCCLASEMSEHFLPGFANHPLAFEQKFPLPELTFIRAEQLLSWRLTNKELTQSPFPNSSSHGIWRNSSGVLKLAWS
jgi:hypothetical protein